MSIKLLDVGHRFDQQPWLFQGITLTLETGRVYALSGPSGSGKSTLLGIIAGWITPTCGTVERHGSRTQWVFQAPHGMPTRRVLDHVMIPLLAQGEHPRQACTQGLDYLSRVGLKARADADFRELSGGEAQRLMLARALATRPQVLLVDEPTAQLDPTTALTVTQTISGMANDDTVIVVATHDAATRDACSDLIDLATLRPAS